ncbi:hypothetical protein [Hyphomicrobium nitrativorans]|uniref:hypothetical protein n=1 Tax=Hyphomicrobium nitrativorans TaxID=1427356 RepID=UPI000A53FF01|nr:hypothetical protein [Hyphomicrobium nitrativorans]
MIKGHDFAIPIERLSNLRALFGSQGALGLLLNLFSIVFLNLSIAAVALFGFIMHPTTHGLFLLFLAALTLALSDTISRHIEDIKVLRRVSRHIRRFKDCRFEVLNDDKVKRYYGIMSIISVTPSLGDVKTFYMPIVQRAKIPNLPTSFQVGYRFLVTAHCPPQGEKSGSFDTYASKSFRFTFLPHEPRGTTRLRQFSMVHELAGC